MKLGFILGLLATTGIACGPSGDLHWVPFVKLHGITYHQVDDHGRLTLTPGEHTKLGDDDLGPEFATVKFKVADNVHRPGYHLQDGDAAFLESGTPIYTVRGYKPEFRLAARYNGQILLFEASTNPRAQTGSDLLDIGGKVRYIGLNSTRDSVRESAAITDPLQVTALVDMVLGAPVDHGLRGYGGLVYSIAFHLADGTVVNRNDWLDSGEMLRGIMLPQEVRTAFDQALEGVHGRDAAP